MKKSKHIVKIHKKMYNIFILYIKICLIFIVSISIFQLFPYNSFANHYIEPHIIENSGTYYFKKGSINNEFFVVHTSDNNEDSINIILNIENQETISIHNKGSWASIDLYNGNDHLLDNPPVIAQINGNIDIYQTMRTNTDCRAINIFNSTSEQDELTITGKTSIYIDTAPTENSNYSTNWLEAIRTLGGTVNLNGGTHISMDITQKEQSPLLSNYYIAGIYALSTDENAIYYEDYIEPPDFTTEINLENESTIDGITVQTSSENFVSSAALKASGTKASINVDGPMTIRNMTTQNTQGDAYTYGVYTENGARITFKDGLSISNLKAPTLNNNYTEAFALFSYGGGISVTSSDKDIVIIGETGAFSQEETDIPNIDIQFNTANSSLTGIAMLREPDWTNGDSRTMKESLIFPSPLAPHGTCFLQTAVL